jgi:anthranilate synthase/aminodeoxychorismate synthase-like glutamine amidotransferase
MLLLIDNYDSFVYNLSRYFVELGCQTCVVRNDAISVDDVRKLSPQAIVISPGPCTPREAGISIDLIREFSESIPLLGVCLGHQAIAAAWGGNVIRAVEPVHGRASFIQHSGSGLFEGLPSPLRVTRYHSLVIEEASLPSDYTMTAWTHDRIPMAIQHRTRPVYGVQFHPESVLTQHGRPLLANFLRLAGIPAKECSITDWKEPQSPIEERGLPVISW